MNIFKQLKALAGLTDPNATMEQVMQEVQRKADSEPDIIEPVIEAFQSESEILNNLHALIGSATESVTAVRQVLRNANADEVQTLIAEAAPEIWALFERAGFDPQELLPEIAG